MSLGEIKPFLTALVLPPTSPLLLVLAGIVLLAWTKRRRTGLSFGLAGTAALWLLSCHGFVLLLASALLPAVPAAQPAQLANVQAIVVLGGGVQRFAPEYGAPQPSGPSLMRVRYGAWLARQTGKPLAFAGGVGWISSSTAPPEAEVVRQALMELGVPLRWADTRSRDTAENARETRRLLAADGISRVAVVTDEWHMPRALREFKRAGLDAVPAPMGFLQRGDSDLLDWLPSTDSLHLAKLVLKEALGTLVLRTTQLFD